MLNPRDRITSSASYPFYSQYINFLWAAKLISSTTTVTVTVDESLDHVCIPFSFSSSSSFLTHLPSSTLSHIYIIYHASLRTWRHERTTESLKLKAEDNYANSVDTETCRPECYFAMWLQREMASTTTLTHRFPETRTKSKSRTNTKSKTGSDKMKQFQCILCLDDACYVTDSPLSNWIAIRHTMV